jgi:hypothetical protein
VQPPTDASCLIHHMCEGSTTAVCQFLDAVNITEMRKLEKSLVRQLKRVRRLSVSIDTLGAKMSLKAFSTFPDSFLNNQQINHRCNPSSLTEASGAERSL